MFSGFCLGGGLFLGHLVALVQRGKQTAQADVHRTQVGDLVDFELGVQLAACLQDLAGPSVVMASTPQPKETSCTRSISFWVVQYLAAAYRRLW